MKTAIHRTPIFNPGRLTDEESIATFIARRPIFDRIIADLAAEKPRSRAQHHVIIGQRGMGKTTLLTRIRAELNTVAALKARFIPLTFAEEQYSVDRLSKFWLNCLDALADALDHMGGSQAQVDHIDDTVSRLNARLVDAVKNDPPVAEEALAAFLAAAEKTKLRPVLLVDNLQLLFDRLDTAAQHALRELLMRPGSPILIAASPSTPPDTQDYGAAFYDHFKHHQLHPLKLEEMRDVMLHLADNAQRDDVRQRILQHPERLAVLRQLTGGNPRTTATLYSLYTEHFAPSVYRDLEDLLDRVTALYKSRFEELPAQQQVVASAVANHWDPVTAAVLGERTGLAQNQLSPQLDRLEKAGFIERVALFGKASTGWQIAERFFNIWFLMRSASRRQRREVEFLTRFLQSFYEADERRRLGRSMLGERDLSPDRYTFSMALAESIDEPHTAESVRRHAHLDALREKAREARRRFAELIDLSQLPPATLKFDQLRKKLMSLVPKRAGITPEAFAEEVLGDREMFRSGERERLASKTKPLTMEELRRLRASIARARKKDAAQYSKAAVEWLSDRLASGQLLSSDHVEDWNRAFCEAEDNETCQLMVRTLPSGVGVKLSTQAIGCVCQQMAPSTEADAGKWLDWGYYLDHNLQRYTEAEAAYRESIIRDPKIGATWNNLGNLLQEHLGRYAEAEIAYRDAIACDAKFAWPWNGLGNLLQIHLKRPIEAESAYREAIARNSKYAQPWHGLARLLQKELGRPSEAEVAYRNAIDCNPKFALPWIGLGSLLQFDLRRPTEAETAYREASTRDLKDAIPCYALANLLKNQLDRPAEAESAYREAILRDPSYAPTWNSLGNLFCDDLGRLHEADDAFSKCLELDPSSEYAQQNLLFLHRDFLGDGSAAKMRLVSLEAKIKFECPDVLQLHRALFSAYDSNWGTACEFLAAALELIADGFPTNTGDDWQRASAVLLHLNYGAELLAFLVERGDDVRLRPWYEALRALHLGDKGHLQNVAPEIRTVAEKLYDGIERRLNALPESTRRRPKPEAPAKRRRKR